MGQLQLQWSKLTFFKIENVQQLIDDNCPGVYRLSYKADDQQIFVFFVGHSDDLKQRLQFHLSQQETNVCVRNYISIKTTYFRYAKLEPEIDRDSAQRFLQKFYQPSCNEKIPQGDDSVTLNIT